MTDCMACFIVVYGTSTSVTTINRMNKSIMVSRGSWWIWMGLGTIYSRFHPVKSCCISDTRCVNQSPNILVVRIKVQTEYRETRFSKIKSKQWSYGSIFAGLPQLKLLGVEFFLLYCYVGRFLNCSESRSFWIQNSSFFKNRASLK